MPGWTLVASQADIERAPAERVFGTPHPRLGGHVLSYTSHDFPDMPPMTWRVAPLGVITMVLDFEVPLRREAGTDTTFPVSPVNGLRDRPMMIEQSGPSRGIAVALTPLGAYALFGLPLRELANTSIGLADLLGGCLIEQLAETDGWDARFRLLDEYLKSRIGGGPELARPVEGAWHRLNSSRGLLRISTLADEIGWTRQHLNIRFREQIGLTPKTVARIARLHRAASMMTRPSPLPWSDIAVGCGYADQSHLNRDFRALTGCTPSEFVRPLWK
jgi:AraC-like DNA-binding protein